MTRPGPVAGAYVAGASPVHLLDPRVKVVLLLALTTAAFLVGRWEALAAMVLALVGLLALSGVPLARLARGLAPLTLLLVALLALNALRLDGTGDVGPFGWRVVSSQGALRGAVVALRVVVMVAASLLLTSTTSSEALGESVLSLLRPLRALRVPVDDVASEFITIALRLIPVCAEQLDRVVTAQRARGARVGQGGALRRVTSWVPVVIPLVVGLFRRARTHLPWRCRRAATAWGSARVCRQGACGPATSRCCAWGSPCAWSFLSLRRKGSLPWELRICARGARSCCAWAMTARASPGSRPRRGDLT